MQRSNTTGTTGSASKRGESVEMGRSSALHDENDGEEDCHEVKAWDDDSMEMGRRYSSIHDKCDQQVDKST